MHPTERIKLWEIRGASRKLIHQLVGTPHYVRAFSLSSVFISLYGCGRNCYPEVQWFSILACICIVTWRVGVQ